MAAVPSRSPPRPTRVAAYALHFQMPVLPVPTPPSLLKRRNTNSPPLWASPTTPCQSTQSTPTGGASSLAPRPVAPVSPKVSATTRSAVDVPGVPFQSRRPSVTSTLPPPMSGVDHVRRDSAPQPGSRILEVDEFDAEFGLGMEIRA